MSPIFFVFRIHEGKIIVSSFPSVLCHLARQRRKISHYCVLPALPACKAEGEEHLPMIS